MARAGLSSAVVVSAGAALADEVGFPSLTMGLLAKRLGVRTPSLYKHVAGQEELNRAIAVLAANEAAAAVGAAIQGYAGRDALVAGMRAFRDYVVTHSGRFAATTGMASRGPDDPWAAADGRIEDAFAAILRGYPIEPENMIHAMRAVRSTVHGFAYLQVARGFQWPADVDESFEWLITLTDRGLRAA